MLDCQAAYRYFNNKSLPHSDNMTLDQICCYYTVTKFLNNTCEMLTCMDDLTMFLALYFLKLS